MIPFNQYLQESSLSRIIDHIKNNTTTFGVVSAFRAEYSQKENMERHEKLKKRVRAANLGFIEMRGGYKGDQGFVSELSLFIPNVSKQNMLNFGKEFDQHSVIYKDDRLFSLVATNKEDRFGAYLASFDAHSKDTIELSKNAMKDFFSQLLKGSQRGKKFLFRMQEKYEPSFFERAYAKATPQWKTIWEENGE